MDLAGTPHHCGQYFCLWSGPRGMPLPTYVQTTSLWLEKLNLNSEQNKERFLSDWHIWRHCLEIVYHLEVFIFWSLFSLSFSLCQGFQFRGGRVHKEWCSNHSEKRRKSSFPLTNTHWKGFIKIAICGNVSPTVKVKKGQNSHTWAMLWDGFVSEIYNYAQYFQMFFSKKKMVLRQSEASGRLGGTLEVSNLRKLLVKNKLQGAHSTFQRGQPTRKDRLRQRLQDGLANHRSWLKLKLIRQRSLSSTIVFIIIILFASLASAIPFDGHSMRISKRLARNEGSGYIGRSFPLQWNFVLWNTFSEKLYKEKSVLFSETFFQTRFDEVLLQNISMIYSFFSLTKPKNMC